MPRAKLALQIDDAPGAVDFLLSVDCRYFSQEETVALVQGMEAAVVEAALAPATATAVDVMPAPV
jgi:hypothetical protein